MAKRQRTIRHEEIGYGKFKPFQGIRGRSASVRELEVGASPPPRNPNSFRSLPGQRTQDQDQHPEQYQADWQPLSPDAAVDAHDAHKTDRRKRREREREQASLQWQELLPEHLFLQTCSLAHEGQRRQQLQERMQKDFAERIAAASKDCPQCNTAEHLQPVQPAPTVTYANIHAHVSMSKPEFRCSVCSTTVSVHPLSIHCFPATPRQATVWYDSQILVATSAFQQAGPIAVQAYCASLRELHMYNGCGPGQPSMWTHLSTASKNWHRIQVKCSCTVAPCNCCCCLCIEFCALFIVPKLLC